MSQRENFQHSKAVSNVEGVALQALSFLAAQSLNSGYQMSDASIQDTLLDAVRQPDRRVFDQAIAEAVATGVSRQDIVNLHIPEIARAMGQAWLDDEMDFAAVSIGCARLQGHLRRKGLDWCDAAHLTVPIVARALLIVPEFEQHTLGATLLAGQLRAQGIYVATEFSASSQDTDRAVAEHNYDAILVSSSRSETIALLSTTVFNLREQCSNAPIIIGGNVLEQVPDTLDKTGADFTAKTWQNALDIILPKEPKRRTDNVGPGR